MLGMLDEGSVFIKIGWGQDSLNSEWVVRIYGYASIHLQPVYTPRNDAHPFLAGSKYSVICEILKFLWYSSKGLN